MTDDPDPSSGASPARQVIEAWSDVHRLRLGRSIVARELARRLQLCPALMSRIEAVHETT